VEQGIAKDALAWSRGPNESGCRGELGANRVVPHGGGRMFYLEVIGIVIVVNVATLPWAWLAWRAESERTQPCETFRLTELPEYQIHAATTQELPTTKSSPAGITTSCVLTLRRLTGRMRFWPVS
jgi:hypothetical protein